MSDRKTLHAIEALVDHLSAVSRVTSTATPFRPIPARRLSSARAIRTRGQTLRIVIQPDGSATHHISGGLRGEAA